MICPSCGAGVTDPAASFCSRCGAALGGKEAEATSDLDAPVPGGETREAEESLTDSDPRAEAGGRETGETRMPASPAGGIALMSEMAEATRRAFVTGGWPAAVRAAAVVFVAVLAVGAVFLVVAKLVDPALGSDEGPLWVLSRIVVAGLWAVGVPIEREGSGAAVLPLGALAAVAWVAVGAGRWAARSSGTTAARDGAVRGAKLGVPLGIILLFGALAFRIDDGAVGAAPGAALLLGLLWGALFGALGGLGAGASTRAVAGSARRWAEARSRVLVEGVVGGWMMLAAGLLIAGLAALLFLIVELAASSGPLSAGEAIAFLVALIAFFPNILVGMVGFALGAPVDFVAASLGTEPLEAGLSLLGWGGSTPAWWAYSALSIPVIACTFGGYAAGRRTADPAKMLEVLGIAAAAFAVSLGVLAYVTRVTVGAAFLGPGNFLIVALGVGAAFVLALVWGGALGIAGWRLAAVGSGRPGEP